MLQTSAMKRSIANIKQDKLEDVYHTWMNSSLAKSLNCHCPKVRCLGPNLLVKDMYYKDVDFKANELRMNQ